MNIDGNDPAHPSNGGMHKGLTKREYFAAKAMQGLASKNNSTHEVETCARIAIEMADALIAALNKGK